MPIRFRCGYCRGRLSIATRKAGTDVACPKCGLDVSVPYVDDPEEGLGGVDELQVAPADAVKTKAKPKKADAPLFEGDIDQLLKVPAAKKETEPVTTTAVAHPLPATVPDGAITISRGALAVAGVLVCVLIGIAFAAGYIAHGL